MARDGATEKGDGRSARKKHIQDVHLAALPVFFFRGREAKTRRRHLEPGVIEPWREGGTSIQPRAPPRWLVFFCFFALSVWACRWISCIHQWVMDPKDPVDQVSRDQPHFSIGRIAPRQVPRREGVGAKPQSRRPKGMTNPPQNPQAVGAVEGSSVGLFLEYPRGVHPRRVHLPFGRRRRRPKKETQR